jgi:hypothetical protein
MTKQLNQRILTPDRIQVGLKIRNTRSPEFGVYTVTKQNSYTDEEDGITSYWWSINNGKGSTILDEFPGLYEIVR